MQQSTEHKSNELPPHRIPDIEDTHISQEYTYPPKKISDKELSQLNQLMCYLAIEFLVLRATCMFILGVKKKRKYHDISCSVELNYSVKKILNPSTRVNRVNDIIMARGYQKS